MRRGQCVLRSFAKIIGESSDESKMCSPAVKGLSGGNVSCGDTDLVKAIVSITIENRRPDQCFMGYKGRG